MDWARVFGVVALVCRKSPTCSLEDVESAAMITRAVQTEYLLQKAGKKLPFTEVVASAEGRVDDFILSLGVIDPCDETEVYDRITQLIFGEA